MQFAAAGHLIQESFLFNALIALMENGNHCPVVTEVAPNVRIMRPASGLTDSRGNYAGPVLHDHFHIAV